MMMKTRGLPRRPSLIARRFAGSVLTFGLVLGLSLTTAGAQQGGPSTHSGSVFAGIGTAPDFPGSDDYSVVPLVGGRYSGPIVNLETRGLGLRLDFLSPQTQGRFQGGVAFNYRGGRDDVEDSVVDQLPTVDGSFEIGGFAGVTLPGLLQERDGVSLEIEGLFDVSDGHGGYVITPSIGYGAPIGEKWRFGMSVAVPYASDDFNSSFFDVTAADSALTGLDVHNAEGGFYATTFGTNVNYAVTEQWGVTAIASYSRLIGEAAGSSIVEDRGSPNQFFGGLGVSYRF